MSVIGIVGEYDPFHYGHKHHIEQTKAVLGEDSPVVCVMSGDFIQRGEAAIFSKYARAEAALKGGADLVLELPLPWVLSSAEGFARGAVGLLAATGVVTHLSFGSECGDTEPLCSLAELMLDPGFGSAIRSELELDEGIPFALARERAAEKRIGDKAKLLKAPNNILAVEYIKAIYDQSLPLKPVTVPRFGAGHDASGGTGPRSASEIRAAMSSGVDIAPFVPEGVYNIYEREKRLGRGPVFMSKLEIPVLSRLRMLDDEAFASLPDAGEGLENRLCRAARSECSLDAVVSAAKSKRYALSRIRRMTVCAALGIKSGDAAGIPPYIRVLAANSRGCELLRRMDGTACVPVVTKPASVNRLDAECKRIFDIGSAAHDLFVLAYPAPEERKGGSDWRSGPIIV